jgi:aryl-alcohol dehydrogenase-like predicted oxidoreductase
MQYRQLGSSGVRVSTIGLGTNRFGVDKCPQQEVNDIIDAALDLGVNHIDTADVYAEGRSEETLGVALKGRWDRVFVATKFSRRMGDGPNDIGASRYHMMHAVEASLRRLQSDHIDLYYLHLWDETTPIEETLRGLDDLIRQGKVRYVGASGIAAWQLARANVMAELQGWSPFVVVQSHYHLLERDVERDQIPYCQAHDVGFIPYFPLAGGFLTGKYQRNAPPPSGSRGETNGYVREYMTDANYDAVEELAAWAADRGRTLVELAEAWLLAQPRVCSVISGVTGLDQFLSNVKGADWALTPENVEEINAILEKG